MEEDKKSQPFSIYCNSIQLTMNLYDFEFTLFNRSLAGTETLGSVKMAPQHAIMLRDVLVNNIEKYEQMFGKIPQPTQSQLNEWKKEGKVLINNHHTGIKEKENE